MKYLPKFHSIHLHMPTARQWAVGIKHLSIIIMLVVFFFVIRINAESNRIIAQTQQIAETNQMISKQNQQHIDCIASLFARYTRDTKPITQEQLTTCDVEVAPTN